MGEANTYRRPTCGGYHAGHPWYYVLGGRILGPKQILRSVVARGYQGYLASKIALADRLSEPQRCETLRSIKAEVLGVYRADLERYRELARDLHRERKGAEPSRQETVCRDLHMSLSLKHNHLFNDLAHLNWLGELLTKQGDLFDL